MSHSDEEEYWRLQTAISRIEALIGNGTVAGNSQLSSMLLSFTDNARKRIDQIEHDESLLPENEKRQRDANQLVVVKYLAEKETALNAAEQDQYSEFLSREYFTKSDFGKLDSFYSQTWDRLSEGGKAQMSHRVWEGVRRDEYQFSELPEKVKEKEAERVYGMLSGAKQMPEEMKSIPVRDRSDFTRAWDSGRKNDAYTVLDRPSFKENVSVTPRAVEEERAVESKEFNAKEIKAAEEKPARSGEAEQAGGQLDLTAVNISIGDAGSKAISPARLSEPKAAGKIELGGS